MRAKREQITIDLPADLRYELRIAAFKRHMTLRAWLIAVIADALRKDKEFESVTVPDGGVTEYK